MSIAEQSNCAYRDVAVGKSYHGLGGESLDLLDGTGSSLLEGNTMQLYT